MEGRIYNGGPQLKLARTWAEVLSVGQRLQDGARVPAVDTREWDAVTAPLDYNALVYHGVVDDQSGDSEGGTEGSGGDAESCQRRTRNRA